MNNLHDNEIKNTMISQVDEVLSGSDETTRSINNQLKFQKMEKRGKVAGKEHLQILSTNVNAGQMNINYDIYEVFNPNRQLVSSSTKNLEISKNNKDNLILSSTSPVNIGDGLKHQNNSQLQLLNLKSVKHQYFKKTNSKKNDLDRISKSINSSKISDTKSPLLNKSNSSTYCQNIPKNDWK